PITNTAQVTATEVQSPVFSNQATVTVSGTPQLQISKTADVTSARPGDFITYTISVTNAGTGPATGGIITDSIPANTSLVQIFEGGTQHGNSVVWNLATGNPGSTATVHFRVQVQQGASGAVNNVAQVRSN